MCEPNEVHPYWERYSESTCSRSPKPRYWFTTEAGEDHMWCETIGGVNLLRSVVRGL